MIRIALIDGDAAIRAGRRLMIDSQPNMQLVFEESEAQHALGKTPELLVDVIVIDHRLKGFDGLELTRLLVDAYSLKGELCPTVIITGAYATPELVIAALRCGAADVVTQDAPMSELLTAINNAKKPKAFDNFANLEDVLNQADYRPLPDPLFVLRRSQLNDELTNILDLLENGLSLKQVERKLAVFDFQELVNKLLIQLHFATIEQLYLALHDNRASKN